MERKIGERFSYNGTTLEVVENSNYNCEKCFFFQRACDKIKCLMTERTDCKNVYFMEVQNMERKIGEIFEYNDITLEVVENPDGCCDDCYFEGCKKCKHFKECSCIRRTDKKDVIFKEIEK